MAYDDPNLLNDVQTFDNQFGLLGFNADGHILKIVNQSGQAGPLPGQDPTGSWENEEAMDVEWAQVIAPWREH